MFEGRNQKKIKKGHKWRRKKYSFTKTMYCVTSQSQQWQYYLNCTLNYFCTHPILQIWHPVTTGCLQTPKECSRERDLAPKFEAKEKSFDKRHWIAREALKPVYHPRRRLCWWIVRGFRSLVEVESTYWGVVKLFNTQNKLMDVHQPDISKILLSFFHLKLSFLYAH